MRSLSVPKSALNGAHFQSVEEATVKIDRFVENGDKCFEQWKSHMQRCIDSGEKYVGADKSQL